MKHLLCFLCAFSICSLATARVRRVEINQDQVATVKTALGIATIIQVPDRPNSIVVGDQAAFKVEYMENAITIKPLRSGANSNLYIFTDYRRFNVQLITSSPTIADYVVYLDSPKAKDEGKTIRWKAIKAAMVNERIRVNDIRVTRTRDDMLFIGFHLTSQRKEKIRPEWFWVTQHGATRPIQNFFLSSLESSPGNEVTGTIQILESDIDESQPIKLELRKKKTSSLLLPKVASWK